MPDGRKQTLYLTAGIIEEVRAEAERQDRTLSWIIQRAWMLSRDVIANYPTMPDTVPLTEADCAGVGAAVSDIVPAVPSPIGVTDGMADQLVDQS